MRGDKSDAGEDNKLIIYFTSPQGSNVLQIFLVPINGSTYLELSSEDNTSPIRGQESRIIDNDLLTSGFSLYLPIFNPLVKANICWRTCCVWKNTCMPYNIILISH